ncbi:MAG: hypothetical protein H6573_16400 [Lewinellaceae bacterium]|nr:hypothetical protein [Lewinellaceae bacterium]
MQHLFDEEVYLTGITRLGVSWELYHAYVRFAATSTGRRSLTLLYIKLLRVEKTVKVKGIRGLVTNKRLMASRFCFTLTIKPATRLFIVLKRGAKTWLIERCILLNDTGKSCQYFHCCSVIRAIYEILAKKAASHLRFLPLQARLLPSQACK